MQLNSTLSALPMAQPNQAKPNYGLVYADKAMQPVLQDEQITLTYKNKMLARLDLASTKDKNFDIIVGMNKTGDPYLTVVDKKNKTMTQMAGAVEATVNGHKVESYGQVSPYSVRQIREAARQQLQVTALPNENGVIFAMPAGGLGTGAGLYFKPFLRTIPNDNGGYDSIFSLGLRTAKKLNVERIIVSVTDKVKPAAMAEIKNLIKEGVLKTGDVKVVGEGDQGDFAPLTPGIKQIIKEMPKTLKTQVQALFVHSDFYLPGINEFVQTALKDPNQYAVSVGTKVIGRKEQPLYGNYVTPRGSTVVNKFVEKPEDPNNLIGGGRLPKQTHAGLGAQMIGTDFLNALIDYYGDKGNWGDKAIGGGGLNKGGIPALITDYQKSPFKLHVNPYPANKEPIDVGSLPSGLLAGTEEGEVIYPYANTKKSPITVGSTTHGFAMPLDKLATDYLSARGLNPLRGGDSSKMQQIEARQPVAAG
jgi:hypothetical protein